MIERLILSRFRGIGKGVIKDMGELNLLIGPNNSGKTTILEALYWLSASGSKCGFFSNALPEFKDEDGLSRPHNAFIPITKDLLGFSLCPRIWKRHGKPELWQDSPGDIGSNEVAFYRIPHLNKDEPFKEFQLHPPPSEEIRDTERFDDDMPKTTAVFVLDDPIGAGNILQHYLPDLYPDAFSSDENVHKRFAFTWFPDFIYWNKGLGAWAVEGNVADADCVLFFDFHTTGDYFTENFWLAIRSVSDWRDQLTHAFGSVFDMDEFLINIEPHPVSTKMMQGAVEIKGKGTIPIDDFGDGARHAFKVLAGLIVLVDRCKDGKEGIFLWEDPELFMHSKSLYRLINQVMDIIENKPIQVFISTQSLEMIALFAMILKERPYLQDKSRIFRLNLHGGELMTAGFKYPKLEAWLGTGWDPRFWNQTDVFTKGWWFPPEIQCSYGEYK